MNRSTHFILALLLLISSAVTRAAEEKALLTWAPTKQGPDGEYYVKFCGIYPNKVIKSIYLGGYFMLDEISPVKIDGKTYDMIHRVTENPTFKKNNLKALKQKNSYWAYAQSKSIKPIPLEFHKNSKYAQRMIKLVKHLCTQ